MDSPGSDIITKAIEYAWTLLYAGFYFIWNKISKIEGELKDTHKEFEREMRTKVDRLSSIQNQHSGMLTGMETTMRDIKEALIRIEKKFETKADK